MKYTKPLILAVSVIFTAFLIGLIASAYVSTKSIVDKSNESVADIAEDWAVSDLYKLTTGDMTGGEVLNYVRKYKDSLFVTAKLYNGSDLIWTESDAVVNDPASPNYLEPSSLFTCELKKTANGDVEGLHFVQKALVEVQPPTEDIALADASIAHQALSSALGLDADSVSWTTLLTKTLERMNMSVGNEEQLDNNYVGIYSQTGSFTTGSKFVLLDEVSIVNVIVYVDHKPVEVFTPGDDGVSIGFWSVGEQTVSNGFGASSQLCITEGVPAELGGSNQDQSRYYLCRTNETNNNVLTYTIFYKKD